MMFLSRRSNLEGREAFDETPLRIISVARDCPPENPGDLVYEFRIYRAGTLLTRLSLDYHPDIGNRGVFFLEEDSPARHSTLGQFDADPGYDAVKARVIAWVRDRLLGKDS